jgi:hypothetical protein
MLQIVIANTAFFCQLNYTSYESEGSNASSADHGNIFVSGATHAVCRPIGVLLMILLSIYPRPFKVKYVFMILIYMVVVAK